MPVDKNHPFKQLVFDYHEGGIDFNSFDPETGKRLEAKHLGPAWVLLTKLLLKTARDPVRARECLKEALTEIDPDTGVTTGD